MKSNCILWALGQYYKHGGMIAFKRSSYGWWWHFMWVSPEGETWSFDPEKKLHRVFPKLWFEGKPRRLK